MLVKEKIKRLEASRALIDTPEKWIQHKYHDVVMSISTYGGILCNHRYCVVGALRENQAENIAKECGLRHDAESWNDNSMTRHGDVMMMFDYMIRGLYKLRDAEMQQVKDLESLNFGFNDYREER